MNIKRRLSVLEQRRSQIPQKRFRVVTSCVCGSPKLANSTCTRRMGPDGRLTEIVTIDGGLEGWTDEDLEKYIASDAA